MITIMAIGTKKNTKCDSAMPSRLDISDTSSRQRPFLLTREAGLAGLEQKLQLGSGRPSATGNGPKRESEDHGALTASLRNLGKLVEPWDPRDPWTCEGLLAAWNPLAVSCSLWSSCVPLRPPSSLPLPRIFSKRSARSDVSSRRAGGACPEGVCQLWCTSDEIRALVHDGQ